MSKGSTARPFSVPKDVYNSRFDAIFGSKKAPAEQQTDASTSDSTDVVKTQQINDKKSA
jgi:hypothetical protein